MARFLLLPGTWKTKNKDAVKGSFDLSKWLREALQSINVPASDAEAPSITTGQPVRYDATSGKLQRFNGTTWVNISAAADIAS